jgi:CRISPR-associated protein Cas2
MFFLITFDISDNKKRYRAVKVLKGIGVRVQKSVFECAELSEHGFLKAQAKLDKIIDHGCDSIRYYPLCRSCIQEVEWIGTGSQPVECTFKVV